MMKNWLCWASRTGFSNFVLLAEDKKSAMVARELGADVITIEGSPDEKPAAEYGTKEFQDTMMFRTRFLGEILKIGYNFMTADLDSIWLDNPFKYLHPRADLQGQQHKVINISGGLVYVKSTDEGAKFWRAVIECQERNIEFIATHEKGTYVPSRYDEQYCINSISTEWVKDRSLGHAQFSKNLLLTNRFPDGRSFFEKNIPQKQGVQPVVIHNNWIIGEENKVERFKSWGYWAIDEDGECSHSPVVESYEAPEAFGFKIRVLAFDRSESLLRLLSSLSQTDFDGDSVDLTISIDLPSANASEETWSNRKKTVDVANAFDWSFGNVEVEDVAEHRGLLGQWTNGWSPRDDEILVVFEDDLVVSRVWYKWAKAAVSAYAGQSDQLAALSLQSQHTLLGESIERRYGSVTAADVLKASEQLFRFQVPTTWGAILFPRPWRQFLSWLEDNKDKNPCVPTFILNQWYLRNTRAVWSIFYARWIWETGRYTLYTNYPGKQALVTNYREPGLNFKTSRGPTNELKSTLGPIDVLFPKLNTLPLLDFHLNRIDMRSEVLVYRSLQFPNYSSFPERFANQVDKAFFDNKCYSLKEYGKYKEDIEKFIK
jgi:hypothetical protein